jgi:hypothetical protein
MLQFLFQDTILKTDVSNQSQRHKLLIIKLNPRNRIGKYRAKSHSIIVLSYKSLMQRISTDF